MARKAVTLSDVASAAGVSLATASKALNGRAEVKEETRLRVAATARELSFSHNSIARSLSRGRSGTVGLLTSDLEGRFSLPVLMGAEDALGAGEVSVVLCDARGDAIREQRHINTLLSRQIDGLLVVGSRTDARPSLGHQLGIPVIYVYTPSDDPADISLTPDNVEAGRIAARHLITTGRKRIAHVRGEIDNQASADRAQGITEAMNEAGLQIINEPGYGEWTERWGRSATSLLLGSTTKIDAVLCDSDQIARGALDALRARGRSVPDDVALMGFDNWTLITAETQPGITSVDMNLEYMGRLAARTLFASFEGEVADAGIKHLPCRLVVRGSTMADS